VVGNRFNVWSWSKKMRTHDIVFQRDAGQICAA
jgi:hypothetical protein